MDNGRAGSFLGTYLKVPVACAHNVPWSSYNMVSVKAVDLVIMLHQVRVVLEEILEDHLVVYQMVVLVVVLAVVLVEMVHVVYLHVVFHMVMVVEEVAVEVYTILLKLTDNQEVPVVVHYKLV